MPYSLYGEEKKTPVKQRDSMSATAIRTIKLPSGEAIPVLG